MNISVLTSSVSTDAGGLYYSVPALTRHAAVSCSGARVRVLVPRERISEEDRSHWSPLEIQGFRSRGPRAYAFAPGMLPYLRREKPSLLHVHGIWMYPTAAAYCYFRQTGTPWMISPRGMLDPWALQNSAWKKKLVGRLIENRAILSASCLHALHKGELEAIRAFGYRGPVAVIPNGVNLPEGTGVPAADTPIRFLFLSRLHPKKRLRELIEAFGLALARPGAPEMRLDIAGEGDQDYELECRECARRVSANAIHFHGHVSGEEKSALLYSAHWFVLPSHSEGLPMAVLESWAHGCPTLISKSCNLSESFFQPFSRECSGDPCVLSSQIVRCSRKIANFQVRNLAKEWVKTKYCWEEQGKKMAEVYHWLLNKGQKPNFVYRYINE